MDAIFPYVKSEQLFVCPSDTLSSETAVPGADTNSNRAYRYYRNVTGSNYNFGSYFVNAFGWPGSAGNGGPSGQALSAIQAPATTVWAADGIPGPGNVAQGYRISMAPGGVFGSPNPPYPVYGTPRRALNWWGGAYIERHLDTANVLFVDGHVKAMKLDKLVEPAASDPTVLRWMSCNDD
jgi:prepilin-type processing-associated H-X9-DG protein